MALNDPNAQSAVTRPRLRFLAGGQEVPVALSCSVTQTNAFHASRFNVVLAPPVQDGRPATGVGSLQWWSQQSSVQAEVKLGLVSDGGTEQDVTWQSMIIGEVDNVTVSPTEWTVTLDGRDLTRRFIDNRTESAHVNQTSSEIVTALAQKEGLQVQAQATTTLVGRYYQIDHDRISLDQFHRSLTEWDMITMLARYEGFDAFVDGQTLYFQPPAKAGDDPWVARWKIDENGLQSGNVLRLDVQRSLTIAKGIQVVVKSWHGKQNRSFVRGAPRSIQIRDTATTNTQQYIIVRPNLTEDQAQQLANSVYADLSRHERVVEGTAWGDMLLTPRVTLRVTETGTDWDTVYYPVEVSRHVSMGQGFTMDFRAHLLPPAAEQTLP